MGFLGKKKSNGGSSSKEVRDPPIGSSLKNKALLFGRSKSKKKKNKSTASTAKQQQQQPVKPKEEKLKPKEIPTVSESADGFEFVFPHQEKALQEQQQQQQQQQQDDTVTDPPPPSTTVVPKQDEDILEPPIIPPVIVPEISKDIEAYTPEISNEADMMIEPEQQPPKLQPVVSKKVPIMDPSLPMSEESLETRRVVELVLRDDEDDDVIIEKSGDSNGLGPTMPKRTPSVTLLGEVAVVCSQDEMDVKKEPIVVVDDDKEQKTQEHERMVMDGVGVEVAGMKKEQRPSLVMEVKNNSNRSTSKEKGINSPPAVVTVTPDKPSMHDKLQQQQQQQSENENPAIVTPVAVRKLDPELTNQDFQTPVTTNEKKSLSKGAGGQPTMIGTPLTVSSGGSQTPFDEKRGGGHGNNNNNNKPEFVGSSSHDEEDDDEDEEDDVDEDEDDDEEEEPSNMLNEHRFQFHGGDNNNKEKFTTNRNFNFDCTTENVRQRMKEDVPIVSKKLFDYFVEKTDTTCGHPTAVQIKKTGKKWANKIQDECGPILCDATGIKLNKNRGGWDNMKKRRNLYNDSFASKFLDELLNVGFMLVYYAPSSKSQSSSDGEKENLPPPPTKKGGDGDDVFWEGCSVTMTLKPGICNALESCQPQLVLSAIGGNSKISNQVQTISIGLLQIHSIDLNAGIIEDDYLADDMRDDATEITNMTQEQEEEALKCFFTLTTTSGDVHAFEGITHHESQKVVNGLKTIIARFTSQLISGDTNAFSEFYSNTNESRNIKYTPDEAMLRLSHSFFD